MKTKSINAIAREIRNNRNQLDAIVNEFRAYWGKVYRNELKAALDAVIEAIKGDPKNAELKARRYALEQVCAKVKSLSVSDEIRALIVELHDVDGLTFDCLTADYIVNGLTGLDYVDADGNVREFKKANKDATEKTWMPIVRWTEAKVGRYFRLANIRVNESK